MKRLRAFASPLIIALLSGCGGDATAPVPPHPDAFTQVAAGDAHTCAISTAGDAYCWGNAALGRLGSPARTPLCTASVCPEPLHLRVDHDFSELSAGEAHACGLENGRAWCWGFDRFGQLGDDRTVLSRCAEDEPFHCSVDPSLVAVGTPLVQITTDRMHTCALASDGRALCWGWNIAGQLGRGTKDDDTRNVTPLPVAGDVRFVRLSTGFGHTCGIDAEGSAWCWGSNEVGRLGTGDLLDRLVPTPVAGGRSFTDIAAGGSFTCGLTTARAVYCWGWGWEGRLGTGDMWDRNEPTHTLMPQEAVAIAAGQHHACAITHTAALYCWGANYDGQLGLPDGGYRTTPELVPVPEPVVSVSAGFVHTCAITASATLYCWGDNTFGQLGTGDVGGVRAPPLPVGG